MNEIELSKTYEVDIKDRRHEVVAHLDCSYLSSTRTVEIKSLYALNPYKQAGLRELLLEKAESYAREKQAQQIVAYCGPEPFCADGQLPRDKEAAFYERHGFVLDHLVCGADPCMIKQLTKEAVYDN